MSDIPVIVTAAGAQPNSPATLRQKLVDLATSYAPGLTADLPGSLIEDLASTATGGLVLIDQAYVDLVNSLTPAGANVPLLLALGEQAGVEKDTPTNTSVNVVFTDISGTPGFTINRGFTVSDGNRQYIIQDGGIIGAGGSSLPLFAIATTSGSWAVPANSVTQIVTSVPSTVSLTVTNPNTGTPGSATDESWASYRARVLMADKAASQGMPSFLKTLLGNVPGVQPRLIAVQQSTTPVGWKIIVGGGDPYQVAYAIFTALFDISTLVGSTTTSRNITVSINDFPDTYSLTFVSPTQQTVTMSVFWNTNSPNLVSDAAISQLATPALVSYVNSIQASQPMNLYMLQRTFQTAVEPILPEPLLTRLAFTVSIDGVVVPPAPGTGVIAGDIEGYLYADPQGAGISITRG